MLDDDKTVVGDLDKIIKKLEQSNRATSIKQMRNIRMRITTLQEGGEEIPEELAEAYNRLAVESNAALKKSSDKLNNTKGILKNQLKDGIGDLTSGVEGIFGDVLSQLTNNPLFTFAKGFVKSSFGILSNLIPSLNTDGAELLDSGASKSKEPANTQLNQEMEYLKSIELNTANLLAIWQENDETLSENKQSDEIKGDEKPLRMIEPTPNKGFLVGFLGKLATTIKTALLGGSVIAFLMNPLTIGIAALAVGLGLLYAKWDSWEIGEKLSNLPKLLVDFADEYGADFLKSALDIFVKIGDTIGDAIGSIFGKQDIFKNLGESIGEFIFDVVDGIYSAIDSVKSTILGFGSDLGSELFDAVDRLKSAFLEVGTDIGSKLFDIIDNIRTSLKSAFSFFGIGGNEGPSTVNDFTQENKDRTVPDLMDRLAKLQLDNSRVLSRWTDKEENERDALRMLLDSKDKDSQLSRTIQESGESRNQLGSNVNVQNNPNSTITNTAVGSDGGGASPVASSRSNSGAYMFKRLGNAS
jgi:hypothetical protein